MNPLTWARAELLHAAWQRGFYLPPDRRLLEREIFPALAKDPAVERVLFVGVQWYTAHYSSAFEGKVFATIDPSPGLARYGGDPHAVGSVQDIAQHFPGMTFDAIVMSGVIGFGLDDAREVERALEACHNALGEGGWLVLGVNEEKPTHVDLKTCPASAKFGAKPFGPQSLSRLDVTLPFRERRHSFLFWQKVKSLP